MEIRGAALATAVYISAASVVPAPTGAVEAATSTSSTACPRWPRSSTRSASVRIQLDLWFFKTRCEIPFGDQRRCVETDNKGAHDLCHRFSSAQHTRHIDRKLFKLREMRGAGLVTVKYLGTEENTADIFTKILDRQPFEKHRKTVLNAAANDGVPSARDKKAMGAWPRRF